MVCLPEGRSLVVDSKLSLLDWSDFVNSTNEIEKENAFARHIKAVRARVAELSSSRYQESFADTPDLVFMFVPLEDAFLEAVRKDKNLLLEAFSKKVYVMGPTSINLAINLVVDTWRQHKRVESFKSMLKRAELLSKKFEGFSEDMNNLGKHLKKAEDSFTRAEDKLFRARGNLDWQVKQLVDGGNHHFTA